MWRNGLSESPDVTAVIERLTSYTPLTAASIADIKAFARGEVGC